MALRRLRLVLNVFLSLRLVRPARFLAVRLVVLCILPKSALEGFKMARNWRVVLFKIHSTGSRKGRANFHPFVSEHAFKLSIYKLLVKNRKSYAQAERSNL